MDGIFDARMSRREFVIATSALSLLLYLDACTFGQASQAASAVQVPPGSSPEEQALRLLHQAVLSSPDHLAQRAADIAATRDATKIVEFVRDRIAVVPVMDGTGDATQSRRWGSAATLRAGLGTLRDRADVLAELLNQAGFKAEVQMADRPSSVDVAALYRPRPAPAFSPDKARIDLARTLLKQASVSAPPAQHAFNPGPDPATAIMSVLPTAAQVARTRDDLLPQAVPVVVFEEGGKKRYAFAMGDIGVVDAPPAHLNPRSEFDTSTVIFTVSALCNPALGATTSREQIIDLVKASWPADQVFGHQLLLGFIPPQGPKAVLDSRLGNLPVRIPVLRLQNDSLPEDKQASLIAMGPYITVHGDVLGPTSVASGATTTDTLTGPYGQIKVLSGADRKTAIASVKSIQGTVLAGSFPDVYLECALRDGSGNPVEGLDGPAFSIKEQGKAVDSFVLYSNADSQPRARVLVIYEGLPEPTPFKDDAAKQAFAASLASAIMAQAAKTPFDVQVIRPGNEPVAGSWAPPTQAGLLAAFSGIADADDPWRSVGGAALDQRISAVIEVGDADVLDPNSVRTAYYQRRLVASGVPVYFMPVGNYKTGNGQQIVSLSGGQQFDIGDPATPGKVANLAGAAAAKWIGGGYRIRYQAPTSGPSQRTVTIGLAGHSQPVATVTYQVPAQPVPPPSFAGLYITIQYGSVYVQRRIAGVQLHNDPIAGQSDPAAVIETRAAMDGITTIAVEPGTPTQAALLDDVITSFLTAAPLVPIWGQASHDQILKAVPNGVTSTPVMLPALLRPSTIDPDCVPGMRVAIIQGRNPTGSAIEVHADLAVGANELVPVTTDKHAAFKAAVATSVAQCANEAATFADTAYSRLSGVAMVGIQNNDYGHLNDWLKTVPAEKLQSWNAIARVYIGDQHLVVPANGAADALWVVDPHTGVAKAVLLDSTGGGFLALGCKLSGFDSFALQVAMVAVMCSFAAAVFPFFCVGVNVLATECCVITIFEGGADPGTPFSAVQPWLGLGEAGLAGLDAALGVGFILITLIDHKCI
ncbi:MAG TPA: hypothetical protein VGV88_11040 [Candidatus Dormibacteraeota bacterium]|nr:hypothetical protein [Candidatus Dormibacteraeota bacterium]